jgi:methyl-accepting chemotaxis protein
MEPRRRVYIDQDIQLPIILLLLFLVPLEGVLVGWGFSKSIVAARQWDRPDQAFQFFKILLLTLVPLVAVNFAIGMWFTHKIVGPLARMRLALAEISRGNLEFQISLRKGDFLHQHAAEMNRMVETLRRLIYRDHGHAAETDQILLQCRDWLAQRKDIPEAERKELQQLLNGAQSRLSIINAHFMKGKIEKSQETP